MDPIRLGEHLEGEGKGSTDKILATLGEEKTRRGLHIPREHIGLQKQKLCYNISGEKRTGESKLRCSK